eukprot:5834171-Prymnesium_polylepis.1
MPVRPDSDRCPNSAATRQKAPWARFRPKSPAPLARRPTPLTCRTGEWCWLPRLHGGQHHPPVAQRLTLQTFLSRQSDPRRH